MENEALVERLNNRWTCEWSAAVNELGGMPPGEAAAVIFKALNPRLLGTRPHTIALASVGTRDFQLVLDALNDDRKLVGECAASALWILVGGSSDGDDRIVHKTTATIDEFRGKIVEFAARPENARHGEFLGTLLKRLDEMRGRLTSPKDSCLDGRPKAPNTAAGPGQKEKQTIS